MTNLNNIICNYSLLVVGMVQYTLVTHLSNTQTRFDDILNSFKQLFQQKYEK